MLFLLSGPGTSPVVIRRRKKTSRTSTNSHARFSDERVRACRDPSMATRALAWTNGLPWPCSETSLVAHTLARAQPASHSRAPDKHTPSSGANLGLPSHRGACIQRPLRHAVTHFAPAPDPSRRFDPRQHSAIPARPSFSPAADQRRVRQRFHWPLVLRFRRSRLISLAMTAPAPAKPTSPRTSRELRTISPASGNGRPAAMARLMRTCWPSFSLARPKLLTHRHLRPVRKHWRCAGRFLLAFRLHERRAIQA
jgi:hypothetical protein